MRATLTIIIAAIVLALFVLFMPNTEPRDPLIMPCPAIAAPAPSLAPPTFAPDPKFLSEPEDLKKA